MKTSELTGAALDWAVALAEGFGPDQYMRNIDIRKDVHGKVSCLLVPINRDYVMWSPSTNWSQGGPIIEREKIDLEWEPNGKPWCMARMFVNKRTYRQLGPTPLVAAMRAYCCARLGDFIEIPKELECQSTNL